MSVLTSAELLEENEMRVTYETTLKFASWNIPIKLMNVSESPRWDFILDFPAYTSGHYFFKQDYTNAIAYNIIVPLILKELNRPLEDDVLDDLCSQLFGLLEMAGFKF